MWNRLLNYAKNKIMLKEDWSPCFLKRQNDEKRPLFFYVLFPLKHREHTSSLNRVRVNKLFVQIFWTQSANSYESRNFCTFSPDKHKAKSTESFSNFVEFVFESFHDCEVSDARGWCVTPYSLSTIRIIFSEGHTIPWLISDLENTCRGQEASFYMFCICKFHSDVDYHKFSSRLIHVAIFSKTSTFAFKIEILSMCAQRSPNKEHVSRSQGLDDADYHIKKHLKS